MRMPDVNILIYAHRTDDPSHRFYREWLEGLVASGQRFALSPLVAVGFLRVVTSARVYPTPTPLAVAAAAIDALLVRRNCVPLAIGAEHWRRVTDLASQVGASGALVADCQHAAVAIEHGCTWVTRDRDFRRFVPHGLRLEMLEPP